MTPTTFLLVLLSELCAVAGQIFFKHAMNQPAEGSRARFLRIFLSGIAAMAIGFFLWLALLARFDLSYLYPFDGLNRIVLLIGASVFLREKMTVNLWIGVLIISAGVALVAAS